MPVGGRFPADAGLVNPALSRYAETHYKFRLPWSPIWRNRPEAVVDAPCLALPGRPIPLVLAIHDAHLFPRRLREVRVLVRGGGEMHQTTLDPDLPLEHPFHFVDLPWPGPEIPGPNLVDVRFELEDRKGRRQSFLNHDLPGLAPESLSVLRLPESLPFPEPWVSCDLHCHTTWSEDPVEWGGDVQVMRRAAHAMGLHFFTANDHSYDFAWDHPDWMRPADAAIRFQAFRKEIHSRDHDGLPLALACEEVSCGNGAGENVHLIVCEHPAYIPGQGDGGRRWLDNRPDLSIPQVLDLLESSSAPAWAAHPRAPMGWVQRKIFRRGPWSDHDLDPRLLGTQFWNGKRGSDFTDGRGQWLRTILRHGTGLLPLAGNDAHGDLNRAIQVATPMVSLRQTRAHRFGHARTWMHPGSHPVESRTDLVALLRSRPPTVLSDGPWLSLQAPGAVHEAERSPDGNIHLAWQDLPGGPGIANTRIYGRFAGADRETLLHEASPGSTTGELSLPAPAGLAWVRAELDGAPPLPGMVQASKALTGTIALAD